MKIFQTTTLMSRVILKIFIHRVLRPVRLGTFKSLGNGYRNQWICLLQIPSTLYEIKSEVRSLHLKISG